MSTLLENMKTWKSIEAEVIARALEDEAFRVRLQQDPRETIETEFHCKIQDGVALKIREEEQLGELSILLPKRPQRAISEKLNDGEVDDVVAAGNVGIAVGIVTTDIVLIKVIV